MNVTRKASLRIYQCFAIGVALLWLLGGGALSLRADSLDSKSAEQTLSPYFQVNCDDDEQVERFPLRATNAEVSIAGVIADVKITQEYENTGNAPIEAIYVFPGSTRAAVYGMTMTIGERVKKAVIKEKQQARADYKKAKSQGKSASLLEQKRPNVFQMNVANIMPGDKVKVELKYTEHLVSEDGQYEFIYPTVVGPRYSNTPISQATESERWVSNPYLQEGEAAPYDFGLITKLNAGVPIKKIASPSHEIDVSYKGQSSARIELGKGEEKGGNRDFILRYKLKGAAIASGVLLYEGEEENFFLMNLQPPKRVKTSEIPKRDFTYIVDISGSMHGFPLEISKKLMRDLLGSLRETDTFNILFFAGGSSVLSQTPIPATKVNIQKALTHMTKLRGGGGTELLPALARAFNMERREDVSRTFVIITDGYVSIETRAFDLIRDNLGRANVFAFGIGSSVNRFLIEGLARAGYGEPFVVTERREAPAIADRFRRYIQSPVLTNIDIDFQGLETYDVEPKSVPDILANRPLVVYGKYRGHADGKIKVRGLTGEGNFEKLIDLSSEKPSEENSALRYLWARNEIASLGDYNRLFPNDERIAQITNLGLNYNLLTKYTSFIAVDDVVRNPHGNQKTVKQPLPLPKGVSNFAVGSGVPSVPEPETYALMAIMLMMLMSFALKPALDRRKK